MPMVEPPAKMSAAVAMPCMMPSKVTVSTMVMMSTVAMRHNYSNEFFPMSMVVVVVM